METLLWTKPSFGTDVQDPLGLELRVSTRMAGQLLHCITTTTLRVRYYSFLPWCIHDYRSRVKDTSADRGLVDAIRQREKALALGCVTHHEGETCVGGAVVGSKAARQKWNTTKLDAEFDLRSHWAMGSLAWNQYSNSLVNLGLFEEMEPTESDEGDLDDEDEGATLSEDDIRLTTLGQQLSNGYAKALGRPHALDLATAFPRTTLRRLASIGAHAGVCEILNERAADRLVLRDLFFDHVASPGKSHGLRRRSLLLLMDLVRQSHDLGVDFDVYRFGDAMLYRATEIDSRLCQFEVDSSLGQIADYWRMFYLHNLMGVALGGIFFGLIRTVEESDREGVRIESAIAELASPIVVKWVKESFGLSMAAAFSAISPAETLRAARQTSPDGRPDIERSMNISSSLAEWRLAKRIREKQWKSMPTSAGLATCLTLMAAVILRFDGLRETEAGQWCGRNVKDPYVDLSPPLVSRWLRQWDPAWWDRPWEDLASIVFDRFVVRQHELLGYDKGSGADSMILHSNDGVLGTTGEYGRVTIGNPRFRFAIQILRDLGLVEIEEMQLTEEGQRWLDDELSDLSA